MKTILTLPLVLALSLCAKDETLTGYGAADRTWNLVSMDGTPFTGTADITFPEEGKLIGQAPCNAFFGAQVQPYPWFEATEIGTTRRTCPEQSLENAFLAALAAMTLVEVNGDNLILSTPEGREMIFRAQP